MRLAPSIPQKVTNLKLKAGKKKQIKLSWNNQKQADGYEIYRSTKKNKGYQNTKKEKMIQRHSVRMIVMRST